MRNNAALGHDGLMLLCTHAIVPNFYTHATLSSEINQTYISLIPKNNHYVPQDCRPIGLCNVIYKIIVKSLANRVKHHLFDYISHSQLMVLVWFW
jgi:hypothetical protein